MDSDPAFLSCVVVAVGFISARLIAVEKLTAVPRSRLVRWLGARRWYAGVDLVQCATCVSFWTTTLAFLAAWYSTAIAAPAALWLICVAAAMWLSASST